MRDVQRMVTTFLRVDRRVNHRMPKVCLWESYAWNAAASRRSMMRIMARRMKAATVRA